MIKEYFEKTCAEYLKQRCVILLMFMFCCIENICNAIIKMCRCNDECSKKKKDNINYVSLKNKTMRFVFCLKNLSKCK